MALNRQTLIKLEGIKGGRFLHIRASPEPLWSHPQASLRHRPSTILVGGEDVPSFSWGGRHRGCTYLQGPQQGEICICNPSRTSGKLATCGNIRNKSNHALDTGVPTDAPTALRDFLPSRPGSVKVNSGLERVMQGLHGPVQGPQTRHPYYPKHCCVERQQTDQNYLSRLD